MNIISKLWDTYWWLLMVIAVTATLVTYGYILYDAINRNDDIKAAHECIEYYGQEYEIQCRDAYDLIKTKHNNHFKHIK